MATQHQLQQNLPTSVEDSYRKKCKDLKKRINEIESSNELLTSRIQRARRAIQRMRLERAFLLQQLESRTEPRVSDSEGSPSPPPTPTSKPFRNKRPRKDAPPTDSPMRQRSPSPAEGTPESYAFVSQSFPTNGAGSAPRTAGRSAGGSGNGITGGMARTARAMKKPQNAYMIFCEKERDTISAREGHREGFEMPKALAQAWRDLKPEGQRPYFDEYERCLAQYNNNTGGTGRPEPNVSTPSIQNVVAPTSTPAAAAPSATHGGNGHAGHAQQFGGTPMMRGTSVGSSVTGGTMQGQNGGGYDGNFGGNNAVSPSIQDESVMDDGETSQ